MTTQNSTLSEESLGRIVEKRVSSLQNIIRSYEKEMISNRAKIEAGGSERRWTDRNKELRNRIAAVEFAIAAIEYADNAQDAEPVKRDTDEWAPIL